MPASSISSCNGFSRIELTLGPSSTLAGVAAAPWLLPAALTLSLKGLPLAVAAGVSLACTAGAITAFRHQRLHTRKSPVRLIAGPHGLRAVLRGGGEQPVRIGSGSRIAHRFLLLHLIAPGGSQRLLLSTVPGIRNTDPHALRRLTGWIRLGPVQTDNK